MNKQKRRGRRRMTSMRRIRSPLALAVGVAALAGTALAEETNEFVFIGDRAVSLKQPGAEVSLRDRFDRQALQARLPGYVVDFVGEMEGADVFEVSKEFYRFLHIRGELSSQRIINIMDFASVVDSTGAIPGEPLAAAYQGQSAECTLGLVYYAYFCRSEHSPVIWYVAHWDEGCPVELHDFSIDGQKTAILDCMRIAGLEIVQP